MQTNITYKEETSFCIVKSLYKSNLMHTYSNWWSNLIIRLRSDRLIPCSLVLPRLSSYTTSPLLKVSILCHRSCLGQMVRYFSSWSTTRSLTILSKPLTPYKNLVRGVKGVKVIKTIANLTLVIYQNLPRI
jgi:hypothetical protein